jgi:hypothetical protein
MAPGIFGENKSVSAHTLMILGKAIGGVFLYTLFTFMPVAVSKTRCSGS